MAVKARQSWYHDNYSKLLIVKVSFNDSIDNGFSDAIPFWNEELILNVDVFFGVADQKEIGV